jgi:hypothetical protein
MIVNGVNRDEIRTQDISANNVPVPALEEVDTAARL